jgi:hypothetical protein
MGRGSLQGLLGWSHGGVGQGLDQSSKGVSQGEPPAIFGTQFIWFHWWHWEQVVKALQGGSVQDPILAVRQKRFCVPENGIGRHCLRVW